MLCFIHVFIAGCNESTPTTAEQFGFVTVEEGKYSITDIDGKSWDITHAVTEYGFDPRGFEHGIGAFNFVPIENPPFLCPGDTNYPPDADFLVIGTSLNGETRAYPISILAPREIANDTFGDVHVSVAY